MKRYGSREDILRHAGDEARLFPRLPPHLREKLAGIPATPNGHPCLVTLKDGSERDCVCVAQALPWFHLWGIWPADDDHKQSLSLENVADLRESPSRRPPAISGSLYDALYRCRVSAGSFHQLSPRPSM